MPLRLKNRRALKKAYGHVERGGVRGLVRNRMEPRTEEGVEKVGDCAKPLLLGAPNGARSRVAPGDRTPFRGEGTRGQIAKPNGAPEGRKSSQVNVLSPLRGSRHVTLHPGFSHPGTGFGHPGLRGCRPSGAPETSILRSPPHFFDTLFRARLYSAANQAPNSAPFHVSVRLFNTLAACGSEKAF